MKIIGGVVQSLFDEWKMSQKYSGFSRSAQNSDGPGPPPFEKLQLEAYSSQPHGSCGVIYILVNIIYSWVLLNCLSPLLEKNSHLVHTNGINNFRCYDYWSTLGGRGG